MEFSRMTSKSAQQPLPLSKNLKRTFESAVREVYQAGVSGKDAWYRRPIAQRAKRAASESAGNTEKRALSDAAKALAQLWKVSPNTSR
jgi:hypothetical protein